MVLLFDGWYCAIRPRAGKAIESLLAGAVEFLGQTVGAAASGKVSEWAHEIAACLNTP